MSSVVKSSIDESSKRCESARYVGTKKVRRCVEDLAEGVCCIANSTFFILPLDYNGNSFQRRGCADCNFLHFSHRSLLCISAEYSLFICFVAYIVAYIFHHHEIMKNEVTLFMVVDLKHTFFFFNAKNEVTLFKVGELIECIALKKFQTDA